MDTKIEKVENILLLLSTEYAAKYSQPVFDRGVVADTCAGHSAHVNGGTSDPVCKPSETGSKETHFFFIKHTSMTNLYQDEI